MRFDAEDYTDQLSHRVPVGLVLVLSVLIAAGTTAGLYFGVGRATAGGGATVPVLVGLAEEEARLAAEGAKLTLEVTGSEPDAVIKRGAVSQQTPLAGALVPIGSRVRVVLSRGLPARPAN